MYQWEARVPLSRPPNELRLRPKRLFEDEEKDDVIGGTTGIVDNSDNNIKAAKTYFDVEISSTNGDNAIITHDDHDVDRTIDCGDDFSAIYDGNTTTYSDESDNESDDDDVNVSNVSNISDITACYCNCENHIHSHTCPHKQQQSTPLEFVVPHSFPTMSTSTPQHDRTSHTQHTLQTTHSHEEQQPHERQEFRSLVRDQPPRKNCCTWKVAVLSLTLVAVGLVVTWKMLPAEDIVVKYLPKFEEPESPYEGPEAGAPGGGGMGGSSSGGSGEFDTGFGDLGVDISTDGDSSSSGTTVPSFMQCESSALDDSGVAQCCNGSPLNCQLQVNQMMFGMVHNANAAEEGGFYFGYNHKYGLEKALVAGYRGINLDVCSCGGGELQFCHNVCDLGERMPNDVFTNILEFLNTYPSEVIVLLFEASTEQGPISWDDLYSEMEGATFQDNGNVQQFVDLLYVHDDGEWPTMGSLVEQNKRIIVFIFNGGTCNNNICPSGFHYFYQYACETQWNSETISDLQNFDESCTITRGPNPPYADGDFFVVNNFVTPPDENAAKLANTKDFLAERLTKCANVNDKRPNFIYLDFWDEGVTAELVQYANAQMAEGMTQ